MGENNAGDNGLAVEVSRASVKAIETVQREMRRRYDLDLSASQVASMLIRLGAETRLELRREGSVVLPVGSLRATAPKTAEMKLAPRRHRKHERKKVPCACGCGELVTTPDANGIPRKWRPGHHPRRPVPKREPQQVPCACGCGQLITTPNKQGRPVRYKTGHSGKRKPAPPKQPVRKTRYQPEPEPAARVVWSGSDPLTPPMRRLPEDRY